MSLPADCIGSFLTSNNGGNDEKRKSVSSSTPILRDRTRVKRPTSPVGVLERTRSISDSEFSKILNSEVPSESSLSLHSLVSLNASSSDDDLFDTCDLSTDNPLNDPKENYECCLSHGEHNCSKRRKKLSLLVPYPRVPRMAEYQCSVCSHAYSRTVADNPWWAVYRHDCPSCHASQVPRIDITKQENAIESDPNVFALYGEGVDEFAEDGDDECEVDSLSILSSKDDIDSDDESVDLNQLESSTSSKLLVLMCHAKICTGVHASPELTAVCRSTKSMMLHLRECRVDDCAVSWCAPCKLMLQHISNCPNPYQCTVCTPKTLTPSFKKLHYLNQVSSFKINE